MRHKCSPEELAEMAEPRPIMYRRNKQGAFLNSLGENVTDRMASSFPWNDDESPEGFEWKRGWTRFRQFYVDDVILREEMPELIAARFTHVVV